MGKEGIEHAAVKSPRNVKDLWSDLSPTAEKHQLGPLHASSR